MDEHGAGDAVRVLSALRAATRASAEEHGVRIGKWLGDGVMLIGMEHDPVLKCALGIKDRLAPTSQPPIRGGVSTGPVILFEGDDYVGRAVNLAARLCAVAAPWQILVAGYSTESDPEALDPPPMQVRGLSRPIRVRQFDGANNRRGD